MAADFLLGSGGDEEWVVFFYQRNVFSFNECLVLETGLGFVKPLSLPHQLFDNVFRILLLLIFALVEVVDEKGASLSLALHLGY